jgi:hypothetical protein
MALGLATSQSTRAEISEDHLTPSPTFAIYLLTA